MKRHKFLKDFGWYDVSWAKKATFIASMIALILSIIVFIATLNM